MHYLRDLIIERIDLIKLLQDKLQKQNNSAGNNVSVQAEFQLNKKILRQYSLMKKREKQRISNEIELLEEMKDIKLWQNKVLEDFLSVSLSIFSRHHSSYLTLLESGVNTAQQLQKLYQQFAQERHTKEYKIHIQKVKNMQIVEFTPAYLLNWICEWSRINFRDTLKKVMSNEFYRHEEELKRISLPKSSVINEIKQKTPNPLSISAQATKSIENIPILTFTNKESVFGLFLQQLTQYYRQLPLQLDTNFIKSMKKLHPKGNQFEREDNLARAVQILIEAKNKHIKEEMELFSNRYYQKYPKLMEKYEKQRLTVSQSQAKVERNLKKVAIYRDIVFQRIKSQNNEENASIKVSFYPKSKDSLLLCPKQAEINFDISKINLSKKIKYQKQLQLPQIIPARSHSKPGTTKIKPLSFMQPINKSLISNYENALLRTSQKGKQFEYKQRQSIEKLFRKNNYSCTNESKLEIFQNPETASKKNNDVELNTNRKLMLQLLRQKNKSFFS